jgi:pimeloyl-ACP methyl ester carboxylesterase
VPTVELSAGPISYEIAGPAAGRPVLCVHGYLMGGSLWAPLGALLAERGLRCLTPTWPLGAHGAPMRREADLTMERVAATVADFLAALDLDDVVLLGVDTGGAVAQVVAVEHPERLGALVLNGCDAFEHFPPPILEPFIAAARLGAPAFTAALSLLRTRFGRSRAYGALAHRDIDDLAREWLTPALSDRRVRHDLQRLTASLGPETTLRAAERLPEFERPALIAWSADDAFFPLDDARRLAAAIPDSRLEVIEGARTFSMLDRPERLAALIDDFLDAARPRTRASAVDSVACAASERRPR